MEGYIKKYFDLITENLQGHLSSSEIPSEEKEKIEIRLEIINELKQRITWQFKSNEEKQVSRLQWLANMRRSDMPLHLIRKQEKAIHIYDQIRLSLPYLKALNSDLLNTSVVEFVNNLSERIDLEGHSFKKDFPGNEEIQNVFRSYFEILIPAKGNGNMFQECYDRIEFLYHDLMKLT